MKVVVVTQQEEVRRIVIAALEGSDDEVVTAADLAAGLAACVEHAPPIAIVDIALAGGAALAMIHHVVASSPRTAIYVLAAPAAFETAGEALSLGATGLIVAPPTGDAVLRAVADIHARVAGDERVIKLASEVRDGSELVAAMTQALLVAKAGDARALAETMLTLFLIASGSRGVAVYGEEDHSDGTRRRVAGFGTALELLERYNDLELAQIATTRHGEVIGLAVDAHMFGCVLLEQPDPARTARVHRVVEFVTALLPLCALARSAMAEDTTAPRSRALPAQIFERLVQRDVDAREGREVSLVCTLARGEVDTGPLGPALALTGAAIGTGDKGDAYVLLPKTPYANARSLLLDLALPVGLVSTPADGRNAATLMRIARARATRAGKAPNGVRELRDRSLTEVITTFATAKHPTLVACEGARDVIESMVLHACRHARALGGADVIVAHPGDATRIVATARDAAGPRSKVRDARLVDSALAGSLVVIVLTPRAGWGLVSRDRDGRSVTAHTSDAVALELLRVRLGEVAS